LLGGELGQTYYKQTERLREPWVWAIVAGSSVVVLASAVATWGGDGSIVGTLILLATALAIPLFVWSMHLTVTVDEKEVVAHLWPFARRRFALEQITSAQARSYHPVKEFGGWGLRRSRAGVRAYTITGDRGVELMLVDGRRVMLGADRATDLQLAIESAKG